MTKLEAAFYEEYKSLDALCRDLLPDGEERNSGIKRYESAMHAVAPEERKAGWKSDLQMLGRVRRLRNRLAHETGVTDCREEDLAFVKAFHERILKQTDPLAMARRAKKRSGASCPANRARGKQNDAVLSRLHAAIAVLVVLLILALVCVYLLFLR